MSGLEESYVQDAFDSNYIAPLGPQVNAFEKKLCELAGSKHGVALTSGTGAIHIALRLLGVEPGDEVFASTLTFIGSVTPVTFLGATPVLIDCDRQSWNMDPRLLESEMAKCARKKLLPKVVIPTDLYGQCVDMERIIDICDGFGVPVVCDSAEALGAKYITQKYDDTKKKYLHAGVGAKAAVYSFNGNKIITTSGGGMLVSDDEEFIEKAMFLAQQARDPFPHYEHSEIGYNYRMSNIVAAIGLGQLQVLDERVKRKREIFDFYVQALGDLPGIEFMPEADYGRCTRWLTVLLITPEEFGVDREAVRIALEDKNIETRPVWKPLHLQPVFDCLPKDTKAEREKKEKNLTRNDTIAQRVKTRYACRVVGGEVSEDLFERGLCLPSGTAMTEEDLERVIGVIRKMHRR